jgi:hypothetical protein
MTASDRPALARGLDRLFATWLKPSPGDRIVSAACEALDAFDLDDIETAIAALITAGGRFVPSIADLRDECRVAQHASRRRYAPPETDGGDVCPECEGVGQRQTSHDSYTFQVVGHAPQTLQRTYWAPCTACARGRQIAANREAKRREATDPRPRRVRDEERA